MAKNIVRAKPTTPGRRFTEYVKNDSLHKGRPEKSLTEKKTKNGGRNNKGRISVRHRGGGHKQLYRIIDKKRDKIGIPGRIDRIEYDPNRTAFIALVIYKDGEKRYIVSPVGLSVNDEILSGSESPIKPGNCLPLKNIPTGTRICCVEMKPGKGAQMAMSAGTSITLQAKEGGKALLRMPSGEQRYVSEECKAVIGSVSNAEHSLEKLGKAGAKRHRGIRPTVRGVAMNPVDHPMGGGEGRTSGGRHPCSPTGVPSKGFRTRKNKRTDKQRLRRRKK